MERIRISSFRERTRRGDDGKKGRMCSSTACVPGPGRADQEEVHMALEKSLACGVPPCGAALGPREAQL